MRRRVTTLYHRRPVLVTRDRLARALLIVLIASATASCRKRAPGTCAEDLDCQPGYDCRRGACFRRERLHVGETKPSPQPVQAEPPPSAEPPTTPPTQPGAGTSAPDASTDVPSRRRPPPPAVEDSPIPTTPSSGREPMWKQRQKKF
jgi:hypothetical protein